MTAEDVIAKVEWVIPADFHRLDRNGLNVVIQDVLAALAAATEGTTP